MHLFLLLLLAPLLASASAKECPCKAELGHPDDADLAKEIEVRSNLGSEATQRRVACLGETAGQMPQKMRKSRSRHEAGQQGSLRSHHRQELGVQAGQSLQNEIARN